jgi:hypothetical protein
VLSRASPDGGAPTLLLALDPDGTLLADGRPYASLAATVVRATDGQPLLTLRSDGTVQLTGALSARLVGDALVAPDETELRVSNDGVVSFVRGERRTEAPVRVEGVTGDNRTTALCLVAIEMLRQR